MFLPTTPEEIKILGWDTPDIILVTGDTYIDSPHIGVALIGKYLLKHGFKTAIIAQPSLENNIDITRLGEPKLFWGVTSGCIDSMVANYTPTKKFRNQDDYTPGGINIRPDRAVMVYTNLIRRHFKNTKPVVLGGIEASLRRISHYDFWDNGVRRSILFDAKADIIAYGMAEKTVIEIAEKLRNGQSVNETRGICYISNQPVEKYINLPSYEEVKSDKNKFMEMFNTFYENIDDPNTGMMQKHADRYLIVNPPPPELTTKELDEVYDLDFERNVHPLYKTGEVRALETIKQSITTHRGCFGQCSFCAIYAHQGRRIISRSIESIIKEAGKISRIKGFNGIIHDIGGATANMYASGCMKNGLPCKNKKCMLPQLCSNIKFGHKNQLELLEKLLNTPGIKKVFVSSGIRHDLVVSDLKYGQAYIENLVKNHVSGQIKLAPEHYDNEVLSLMNKPSIKSLMRFKTLFDESCRRQNKKYFMTYYLMAAHPGCENKHMLKLKDFLRGGLRIIPEQVQVFTPTPSTISTMMYWCEKNPVGNKIFVEKQPNGRQKQKDIIRR